MLAADTGLCQIQRRFADLIRADHVPETLRLALQVSQLTGRGTTGTGGELLHSGKVAFRRGLAQSRQHIPRELERTGGGQHHHRPFGPLFLRNLEGYRGMGVAQVSVLLIAAADFPRCLPVVRPAGGKDLPDILSY